MPACNALDPLAGEIAIRRGKVKEKLNRGSHRRYSDGQAAAQSADAFKCHGRRFAATNA